MKNVLIADDHAVTRRGVAELLRELFEDLVVAEVSDANALLAELPKRSWDLILLDVFMPGPPIIEVLRAIRAHRADLPVLVLTAAEEVEYVIETMEAGASGLIHKHRAPDELRAAVTQVVGGGTYLHPQTAVEVAARVRRSKEPAPHEALSAREHEIFVLIARGRAIKEIAGELALSEKTVATYLRRIRDKTKLVSHVDIARYALQHRLVD